MAFIKKQKLVEEVKEEPTQVITESVEDNLQSALLEVVADELNYVAKLNRMIELAEEAGKDDLVSALKSSRADMKSNIAEVYKRGKKILGISDEAEVDEEPKESVTEAVDPSKVYNGDRVADVISDMTIDFIDNDEVTTKQLEDLSRYFIRNEDYTAEEIDAKLDMFELDQALRETIELEISKMPDARQERMEEFKSDIDSDVSTLENLVEDPEHNQLFTYAAAKSIRDAISYLKDLVEKYDGRPGIYWGINDANKGPIIE